MYYKDIIKPDFIEEYKNYHKIIYRALSIMIFDLAFVENGYELSQTYADIEPDTISRMTIHKDVFALLVLKTYKAFFDNSGPDATTLLRFKNKIVGTYVESTYKDAVLTEINKCQISDKNYKTKFESIETNVIKIRDTILAHNLDINISAFSVYFSDIRELLEKGCELFQALSFRPLDFYSWSEGDGYDFSREFAYTKDSTRRVWEYFYLSSRYIDRVDVTYNTRNLEYADDSKQSQSELENLIESINNGKENERIAAEER